jgi:hypothetical protein
MSWPHVFATQPAGNVPASYLDDNFNAAAPLASPALTGTPTAPTAANGTSTGQIATCAFVLANGGGSGGGITSITLACGSPSSLPLLFSGSPLTSNGTITINTGTSSGSIGNHGLVALGAAPVGTVAGGIPAFVDNTGNFISPDTGMYIAAGATSIYSSSDLQTDLGKSAVRFTNLWLGSGGAILTATASGALRIGQNSTDTPGTVGSSTTGGSIQVSSTGMTFYGSRSQFYGLSLNTNTNGDNTAVFQNSGTNVGAIYTTSSATIYLTSSDYRLKQDLEPLASPLERLAALSPYEFHWKTDPTGLKTMGFIAHEVQAVVPQAVGGKKDDVWPDDLPEEMQAIHPPGSIRPQGVDHSMLVPLLVAAVQELARKVASKDQPA